MRERRVDSLDFSQVTAALREDGSLDGVKLGRPSRRLVPPSPIMEARTRSLRRQWSRVLRVEARSWRSNYSSGLYMRLVQMGN